MTLQETQQIRKERAEQLSPGDVFYCRPRRRRLTIEFCLDDYMNANAFNDKHSACWHCPQGCANRHAYAEGEVTGDLGTGK